MGQYYLIANMDKKEVLTLEGRFPGMKLLEIADDTKTSIAITNIIAGNNTLLLILSTNSNL